MAAVTLTSPQNPLLFTDKLRAELGMAGEGEAASGGVIPASDQLITSRYGDMLSLGSRHHIDKG